MFCRATHREGTRRRGSLLLARRPRESRPRIRRLNKRIEHLSLEHDDVLKALDHALELTDDIQRAYLPAGSQERRFLNQGPFERLEIDQEEMAGNKPAEPFAQVAELGQSLNSGLASKRAAAVLPNRAPEPGTIAGASGAVRDKG